jgi:hypothetical protein
MDQANEQLQMKVEAMIVKGLNMAYNNLLCSDRPEAEEHLGIIAQMKAFWEGDTGSVADAGVQALAPPALSEREAMSQQAIWDANLGLDQQGMLYTALDRIMRETGECVFVEKVYADAEGELYAVIQGSDGHNCGTVLKMESQGWVEAHE